MSAPVLIWSESNGNGIPTDGIQQLQFASIDAPSTQSGLSANHQIAPGGYSFEKFLRLKLQQAAPNTISGFVAYFALSEVYDSASQDNVGVNAGFDVAFRQPINTQSELTIVPFQHIQGGPGIAASEPFTGPTNVAGNYGKYMVLQASVAAGAAQGAAIFPANFFSAGYSWS